MCTDLICSRLESIQKQLLAQYTGGKGLPNATKGNERETLIREFLSKVLPNSFRFGTGCVTDVQGSISGQVDIVIEMPNAPSFPMVTGGDRLYLADSVAAVIEVKSNLEKQWRQMTKTVKKVKQLKRVTAIDNVSFWGLTLHKIPIVAVGYMGFTKFSTLVKKINDTKIEERPDAVLTIDKGFFYGFDSPGMGSMGLYRFIMMLSNTINKFHYEKFILDRE